MRKINQENERKLLAKQLKWVEDTIRLDGAVKIPNTNRGGFSFDFSKEDRKERFKAFDKLSKHAKDITREKGSDYD